MRRNLKPRRRGKSRNGESGGDAEKLKTRKSPPQRREGREGGKMLDEGWRMVDENSQSAADASREAWLFEL
jgi:hypothetical protein